MKNSRDKTMATVIALFLTLTIAVTLVALPAAHAHTPSWQIHSWAFVVASPNPVGVGQTAFIAMWTDMAMPSAALTNDIRRGNFTLTITAPDATTQKMNWPIVSDPTGVQSTQFTPSQVGTYTLKFDYGGQLYYWSGTYQNDTFLPSSATTTLTVQQEPVTEPPTYPLPTEYWTRPIEGENWNWYTIASNYLGASSLPLAPLQPDGTAPSSAHVMWTKPLEFGGVVGGNHTGAAQGGTFYTGLSYETKFTTPLIIQGRLYYPLPKSNNAAGEGYVCVDLQTGEQYWWQNYTVNPSFGQLEWYDSPNQHGVINNGYLWATSGTTWMAFDPLDGSWLFNVTDVPTGTTVYGPSGEILRYVLNVANKWLAMWNFTALFNESVAMSAYRPINTVINASRAYSWNVTIPTLPTGTAISRVLYGDCIFCTQGSFGAVGSWSGANVSVISIRDASKGHLLWTKYYPAAPNNITRSLAAVDPVNRVFLLNDKETQQWSGYSLDDGSLLWGPLGSSRPWDYFSTTGYIAYGKLYFSGYGGILYCYDTKNGSLLWTYGNGGSGNSTASAHETPWGDYPLFVGAIADGKVYLFSTEHSPNAPPYKGSRIRCVDAYTGKELWTLLGWGNPGSFTASGFPVADGYMVYLNHYDMQLYCVGKGPSATTVDAPMTAITAGDSVVIQGTVTDQCAGAKEIARTLGLQDGVAAMSDASMEQWMEYLYMQKPHPTNATGVTVTLDAIDPNNNFIHIGTTTNDMTSTFGYEWTTPDIPGKYTIIATFAGSDSYWPSYAETYAVVSEAPPAPTPTPAAAPTPPYELYTIGTGIAIIIAIAIATILILRKRP